MNPKDHSLSRSSLYAVIAVLVVLSFLLMLLSAYSLTQLSRSQQKLQDTAARYADIASDELANLSSDLVKAMYAGTSPQLSQIASRLAWESAAAKTALNALPASQIPLQNTERFLSHTGDYALFLSHKFVSGEELTAQERENLASLREYADRLSQKMDALACSLSAGESDKNSLGDFSFPTSEISFPTDSLQQMEDGFTGYPTLIYDGPFSDHLLNRTPKMSGEAVSKEQAQKIAQKAYSGELPSFREENSKLPCYVFHDDTSHSVAITKNGGRLCYYVTAKTDALPENLSREQAVQKAQQYLAKNNYPSMKDTYSQVTDGVMTINFAYFDAESQILCYTDLIKVQISLKDGEILGLDARGFLVNHSERDFPAPKLSAEQAKASLSPSLTVENTRLALIPSAGKNEWLTYEFLCTSPTGDKLLSYIDIDTGAERQILLLLDTPGGMLTK